MHPDDQEMFFAQVTKENILRTIKRDSVFSFDYRLEGPGLPAYVRFKAAQIVEDGKTVLVVSVLDEDARVRREQEYARNLSQAQMRATRDQLTGVKNKHAYADAEDDLTEVIAATPDGEFAIVVCDINGLKLVNDLQGHAAGDQLIKDACALICDHFTHGAVYRVGGDEFAVLLQGKGYDTMHEVIDALNQKVEANIKENAVVVSIGYAVLEPGDQQLRDIFDRADQMMYDAKSQRIVSAERDGTTKAMNVWEGFCPLR